MRTAHPETLTERPGAPSCRRPSRMVDLWTAWMRPAVFRRLAGALLLTAACAAHAAGPAPAAADYGTVGYVEIDDIIDRFADRYLARVIERAQDEGVDTLLVRIDTDGGEVLHARTMFKRILDLEAEGYPDRRLRRLPRHLRRCADRLRPRGGVPERDRVDRRHRRRVPDPGGGDQVRPREVRDGGAHTSRAGGGAARLEPRDAAQDDRAQAVALPRHPPRRSGGLRHRGRPARVPRPPPGHRPRRSAAGSTSTAARTASSP